MNFKTCIALCFALLPVLAFSAELNLGKSIEFDDEVTPPTEQYSTELVGVGYVCEIRMSYAHKISIDLRSSSNCANSSSIFLTLCSTPSGTGKCPVSGDGESRVTYDEARLALAMQTLQHAMNNNYRVSAYRSSYYSLVPNFDLHSVKYAHTFTVMK